MTVISENKTKSTYFFPVIISFHNSRSMTALLVMILDIRHLYIYKYIIIFIIDKSISVVVCLRIQRAMQWS